MATPRSRRAARHRARRRRAQHRARRLAVIGDRRRTRCRHPDPDRVRLDRSPEPVADDGRSGYGRRRGPAGAEGARDRRQPPDQASRRGGRGHGDRLPRRSTAARLALKPVGRQVNEGLLAGSGAGSPAPRKQGPVVVPARRRRARDRGARRRRDAGYRRLLAGRRHGGLDLRLRDRRQGYGSRIDVRPSDVAVGDRLAQPPRARPVARRRAAPCSPRHPSSGRSSTSRRSSARRSRSTRAPAATTSRSKCIRPARCRVDCPGSTSSSSATSSDAPAARRSRIGCADLRAELDVDVCVVNGENVADGVGITPKLAERSSPPAPTRSRSATTRGAAQEIAPYLGGVRPGDPAREPPARAHRAAGSRSSPPRDGTPVGVVNVMGSLSLRTRAEHVGDRRRARRRGARDDAGRRRRRPRRGDEREGRARPLARRPGDGGDRHAHARADVGRTRAARRHGRDHRRRA